MDCNNMSSAILRFDKCCKNALRSAVRLVACVSDMPEADVERMYRQACQDGVMASFSDQELDPDEILEDLGLPDGKIDCVDLVKNVLQEKVLHATQDATDGAEANDATEQDNSIATFALEGLEDQEDMKQLLHAEVGDNTEEKDKKKKKKDPTEKLPHTLMEALDLAARSGDQQWWNSIFKLSLFLRTSPGGMGTGFVPNHKNCRVAGRQLNWHQFNCRMLAMMEKEKETPQHRARTGRLAKWRELHEQALHDLQLPPAQVEIIKCLGCLGLRQTWCCSSTERGILL